MVAATAAAELAAGKQLEPACLEELTDVQPALLGTINVLPA